MDVWGITLATLRRWYVFLPIMAVAVLLAMAAGRSANPEYEASGTMLLTPPRVSSQIANPFVNAQGASEAITVVLNGPDTRTKLDAEGFKGTVTVTSAARSSVVAMRSVASSPEEALQLIRSVIDIGAEELAQRQRTAGIKKGSSIGFQILAVPSITSIANDTAVRVQAVILVLGAVAGVTLSVLFDDIVGLIRRRRRRRQRPAVVETGGGTSELPAGEGSPAHEIEDQGARPSSEVDDASSDADVGEGDDTEPPEELDSRQIGDAAPEDDLRVGLGDDSVRDRPADDSLEVGGENRAKRLVDPKSNDSSRSSG